MKTIYKHLILIAILFFLLLIAHVTRAQDSIPEWPKKAYVNGFLETDFPFLCVKYDTLEKKSHIYCVYPHKMFVSVNGGTAVKMGRRDHVDIKAEHFTVVVTRKKYKQVYKI